ncbi:MAG: hypothetical protein WDW38_002077 [Sanguina aurantia]
MEHDDYIAPRVSQAPSLPHLFNQYRQNFSLIAQTTLPDPETTPNWASWLKFSHNWTDHQWQTPQNGSAFLHWPSGFQFQNTHVCGHCRHQFHRTERAGPAEASDRFEALNVTVGPSEELLDPEDFLAFDSLYTLMWQTVRQADCTVVPFVSSKSFVDPFAIVRHGMHLATEHWALTDGMLNIPTTGPLIVRGEVALKYHMRLWRPLIDRLVQRFELDFGVASSAEEDREETGDESWEATLAVCTYCGGVDFPMTVDYSLANLYGLVLKSQAKEWERNHPHRGQDHGSHKHVVTHLAEGGSSNHHT